MSRYALNDYAFQGELKKVRKAIKNGAEIDLLDEEGYSPLHWAIQEGYLDIVRLLIESGADLEKQNREGFSPLHIALLDNQTEIAIEIIQQGVSFEIDTDGYNALHVVASKTGNSKILKALAREAQYINRFDGDGDGYAPLHYAAQENKVKCINVLLQAGADVNLRTVHGFTPLHTAAGEGHVKAVKALIEGQAEVEAENPLDSHATPLMLAVSYDHAKVVHELLQHGADLNHQDANGKTAIDYAKEYKNKKILKLFDGMR
ncbi:MULTISPECIES: ankyrin repeat domain-containing protein [unclassified Exiguobacterium]|uniref:ankyrin repeat domain-containing protein n=1 Tax=unclassified Exiguobacterium TaxID=2644629 RepID=UPI001BE603B2